MPVTEIKILLCDDGTYHWDFRVDGGSYADGYADDSETALNRARAAFHEWSDKN